MDFALTGHSVAPQLYVALGIAGDTEHLAAVRGARAVLAVQRDPTAPIIQFADWNVIADPVQFVTVLLKRLEGSV
jgi:electron transfer flavoprotein alpha subunit